MKKIRELFRSDERMQLIFSASAVGILLIAAMLIPLAFRAAHPAASPDAAVLTEQKAALFAEYWSGMADTENVSSSNPESIPNRQEKLCEEMTAALLSRCIYDLALEDPAPTGMEYTDLTGKDGTEVRLCRMWVEAKGDWQNWLDVCFDRDTGELYYLYLSRECLWNAQAYQEEIDREISAETIAGILCDAFGWTLRYLAPGENGSGLAVFRTRGGTLCCQIECRSYDTLVDVKFCCI